MALTAQQLHDWRPLSRHWPLQSEVRDLVLHLGCARRGCRAGRHVRSRDTVYQQNISCSTTALQRATRARRHELSTDLSTDVPRPPQTPPSLHAPTTCCSSTVLPQRDTPVTPTIYVLNAAALSKPHALVHLATDLKSTGASVAVITETHFKQQHTDSAISTEGYTVFRHDRTGRRGGGVALYVQSTTQSSVWTPSSAGNRAFELLWVRVGVRLFVAALYHPPRPVYAAADLLKPHRELRR